MDKGGKRGTCTATAFPAVITSPLQWRHPGGSESLTSVQTRDTKANIYGRHWWSTMFYLWCVEGLNKKTNLRRHLSMATF